MDGVLEEMVIVHAAQRQLPSVKLDFTLQVQLRLPVFTSVQSHDCTCTPNSDAICIVCVLLLR
jgi:hypothetical protein